MDDEADLNWTAAVQALPLHDQLLHAIGRVVYTHVSLEFWLRHVHQVLSDSDPAAWLSWSRPSIPIVVDECCLMLRRWGLPAQVEVAGEDALREAKMANGLRHRVVHDLWCIREGDWSRRAPGDGAWQFERMQWGQRGFRMEGANLDYIEDIAHRLDRACKRVTHLPLTIRAYTADVIVLSDVNGRSITRPITDEYRRHCLARLRGRTADPIMIRD